MAHKVQAVVDAREPATYKDAVKQLIPDTEIKMIVTGDYVVECEGVRLGMERKTVSDFLSSLKSGRLEAQCGRMREEFDIRILLLEGAWSLNGSKVVYRNRDTGWHVASMQMAIYAFCRKLDMMPMWVPDRNAVGLTFRAFYRRAVTKGLSPGIIDSWQQDAELVTEDLALDPEPPKRTVARHSRRRTVRTRPLSWGETTTRLVDGP